VKKEKIFEFPITQPLTPANRKTVEKQVEKNAHLSPKPITYEWDEDDENVLHIEAGPVEAELRFHPKKVELYGAAPFWVRMLLTEKKKLQIKDEFEAILKKTGFLGDKKAK
jgi:hypothetical protein